MGFGVGNKLHSGVQTPLVIARIKNTAAVQPSYPCHSIIHNASEKERRERGRQGLESVKESSNGSLIPKLSIPFLPFPHFEVLR